MQSNEMTDQQLQAAIKEQEIWLAEEERRENEISANKSLLNKGNALKVVQK